MSGCSAAATRFSWANENPPKQSARIPIRNVFASLPPQPAASASAMPSSTAHSALARIADHPDLVRVDRDRARAGRDRNGLEYAIRVRIDARDSVGDRGGDPDAPGAEGDTLGTAVDRNGGDDAIRRRVDPDHPVTQLVGDPEGTTAKRHGRGREAERDDRDDFALPGI